MKTKLRLVKNTKQLKQDTNKPIPRNTLSAFNRALKAARKDNWRTVIIIGQDTSLFHTPMRYKDLIGLMEMNKHVIIQEWLKE